MFGRVLPINRKTIQIRRRKAVGAAKQAEKLHAERAKNL
jgi:hypothetical protein